MKRVFPVLFAALCGTAIVVAVAVGSSSTLAFSDIRGLFAGVFFTESTTPEALQEKYRLAQRGGERLRLLIVPGHDDESWGTEFRGVREADMTAAVGEELSRLLADNPAYEALLVRTRAGYVPDVRAYFETERGRVRAYLKEKKQTMQELVRAGEVHVARGVAHNAAPNATAEKLYALNLFANERRADMVLHLHFNDYPGRPTHRAGRYDGFSLYVPDRQFSNARASRALAEALLAQLSRFYAESNLPLEDSGVVPDQELIALGSYNTLDAAGVLIEYGYIYEPRFLDAQVREAALKELAFQTYQGLNRFFGTYGELFQKYPTALLPYAWNMSLSEESGAHPHVLALQTALTLDEVYPPTGRSKRDCPLTGHFGPCTASAVKRFQEKHGLPSSGTVGPLTLLKLNEKYGR